MIIWSTRVGTLMASNPPTVFYATGLFRPLNLWTQACAQALPMGNDRPIGVETNQYPPAGLHCDAIGITREGVDKVLAAPPAEPILPLGVLGIDYWEIGGGPHYVMYLKLERVP